LVIKEQVPVNANRLIRHLRVQVGHHGGHGVAERQNILEPVDHRRLPVLVDDSGIAHLRVDVTD
jgi:hypothetical protein